MLWHKDWAREKAKQLCLVRKEVTRGKKKADMLSPRGLQNNVKDRHQCISNFNWISITEDMTVNRYTKYSHIDF